jgi:hypothetical protein
MKSIWKYSKTKWRGLFDIVIVSKHPQVEVIKEIL